MPRLFSTVLVVSLLGGTAAAFAVTEGLKLEKSPILSVSVAKVVGPREHAPIRFRLRKTDRLDLVMIDADDRPVRTLVEGRLFRHGRLHFTWNGRDDAGRLVPEGSYRPRVHLADEHRTIVLPNPIRVDATPPRVRLVSLRPRVFSPDGDGRHDRIIVRYRIDERAHALLYVDGRLRVRSRSQKPSGQLEWYGKVAGASARAGIHRIALAAQDLAGNEGARTRAARVVVRYVALGRDVVRTAAGSRFALRVATDAKTVRWRLNGRTGVARPGTLRLRAPLAAGGYTLYVSANGHAARAAVLVRTGP